LSSYKLSLSARTINCLINITQLCYSIFGSSIGGGRKRWTYRKLSRCISCYLTIVTCSCPAINPNNITNIFINSPGLTTIRKSSCRIISISSTADFNIAKFCLINILYFFLSIKNELFYVCIRNRSTCTRIIYCSFYICCGTVWNLASLLISRLTKLL